MSEDVFPEPDPGRGELLPSDSSDRLPVAFVPVPVQPRQNGWTVKRQVAFIEALAVQGSVTRAAARVGMSVESAYRLRRRPEAKSFADAWTAAQAHATQKLVDLAFERAIDGVSVPVYHGGEVVGERQHYSDQLLMFLLRYHDPSRYGVFAKLMPVKVPDIRAKKAGRLDKLLGRLTSWRVRQCG